MSRKRQSRRIILLKPVFEQIYSCHQKKTEPFLEILLNKPENISQKNLGILFGVFEVNDFTEDSSYIVNYLISVIKKEYFSKPKRGAIESLEASLHKANLSLSKIAKHGNVSWMKKINAVCAVIEKNNLHFSKTGQGILLMFRSRSLTEISEGMHEDNENPLKTFTDISSGKLQSEDKLLITTSEIFELFSKEELKKSALRFSKKAFYRFLNTALCNELEKTATLVIDIQEENKKELKKSKKDPQINAFSQSAFRKKSPKTKKKPKKKVGTKKPDITAELEKIKKEKGDFIDEKTGHIYIKENLEEQAEKTDSFLKNYLGALKDEVVSFPGRKKSAVVEPEKKEGLKKISWQERLEKIGRKIRFFVNNFLLNSGEKLKNLKIRERLGSLIKKIKISKTPKPLETEKFLEKSPQEPPEKAIKKTSSFSQKVKIFFASLTPRISKIKNFKNLSSRQKLAVIAALIVVFVVPLFLIRKENKIDQADTQEPAATQEEASFPLKNESNLVQIENLEEYFSSNNLKDILSLGENNYAVGENKILRMNDQQSWDVPQEFTPISLAAPMEVLNLIFLVGKNNQIISFSPVEQSFQQNQIELVDNIQIEDIQTYTTYLYILDNQSNQIYRYPRAEGGFGERIEWLKEEIGIEPEAQISISENIFLVNNSEVFKLFQGKKENYSLENTSASVLVSKVFTQENLVYILDKEHSLILETDLDGKVNRQLYNQEFKKTQDFYLSQNKIYLLSERGVKLFNLP